jgi:hypothetical protein
MLMQKKHRYIDVMDANGVSTTSPLSELNRRPSHYKYDALAAELRRRY